MGEDWYEIGGSKYTYWTESYNDPWLEDIKTSRNLINDYLDVVDSTINKEDCILYDIVIKCHDNLEDIIYDTLEDIDPIHIMFKYDFYSSEKDLHKKGYYVKKNNIDYIKKQIYYYQNEKDDGSLPQICVFWLIYDFNKKILTINGKTLDLEEGLEIITEDHKKEIVDRILLWIIDVCV